uniref:Uncharacterized protein n=1 Tax=Arundo donax TaxID=35708 RepID=A0A0A9FUR0_ARUDO
MPPPLPRRGGAGPRGCLTAGRRAPRRWSRRGGSRR